MRATIPAAVAVSALVLTLGAAPAIAGKKRQRSCNVKNSVTLAASVQGRVYEKRDRVYACSHRTKRRSLLGYGSDCQNRIVAADFRFGRNLLGYVLTNCNLDTSDAGIQVINLRTGRTRSSVGAADRDPGGGEASTEVLNWAMKRNGSLAWIGRRYGDGPEELQVWKLEARSPHDSVKLDSGAGIDPNSLAVGLRGTESPIYWRKGGAIFSATLR